MRPALIAAAVLLFTPAVPAADPPNLVVILCDDLGYGDTGFTGHPVIRTPHLDALAASGLTLSRCYAASPVCSPSRAGLLTGRVPNRSGILDWIPERSGVHLRRHEVTVAQLLKTAGYRTCHAGKWHLNSVTDNSEPTPADFGFDLAFYTQNNAAPGHVDPVNFLRQDQAVGKLMGASSHLVVDEAISFVKERPAGRFYLNLWFHEPHEPVVAAPEYLALYPDVADPDRRHYYGCVSQLDAAVGKLLAFLDDANLRKNTLIVFTSDNGPETLNRYPGAGRSHGSAGPFRGRKLHVTEGGVRVPGVVSWPAVVAPNSKTETPVSSLDLLPTIAALAGATPPADRPPDGEDITPLLKGLPFARSKPLYWDYPRAISKPWTRALWRGDFKLLASADFGRLELYHEGDTAEATALAGTRPGEVVERLKQARELAESIERDRARSGNPHPAPGAKGR